MSEQDKQLPDANHEEAYQLACYQRQNSNLARCYIELYNRRTPQSTVTKNESGQIVAVTRTDAEGKILEVIAESAPQAQLTDDHIRDATKLILTESEIDLLHDKHMFEAMDGYCMLDYQGFAKAIAARCGDEQLRQQRDELLKACEKTIAQNKHLADGDDCTLIEIKRAVERCKP